MSECEDDPGLSEIDIHHAVGQNDEELIHKFVLGGGNLKARDKDWLTPLHVAAAGGFLTVVEFLMKHKGRAQLVETKSKIGHTPLHLACRFGHLPVVLRLLAEGADINARDNDANTPLHKAASNGKAQLCRELVKRGADVDARNSAQYTPLHWACFKGYKSAAEQLLKCGANIDVTSSQRATGLFMSSFYGHADVTFLLIAWGANTTISNEDGIKPGEAFLPEVSPSQRKQTRVLLSERLALLMKGYEATRRNMALMYMRSERSELNLRMTQGEVETLWSQLGKREKELNRSKIGARDLSQAVKSMNVDLEKTREGSKAAWNKVEALQAELKAAQLEAKQQRERALNAERALAEELRRQRRTGDSYNPSPSSSAEGRDERLLWQEPTVSVETSPKTTTLTKATLTPTESEAESRTETAEESALRRYNFSRFEEKSIIGSLNSNTNSDGAASPWTYSSLSSSGTTRTTAVSSSTTSSDSRSSARASPPSAELSLSLPAGRIAELASAINIRVSRLGHETAVPLPPSKSARRSSSVPPASLAPLRGRSLGSGVSKRGLFRDGSSSSSRGRRSSSSSTRGGNCADLGGVGEGIRNGCAVGGSDSDSSSGRNSACAFPSSLSSKGGRDVLRSAAKVDESDDWTISSDDSPVKSDGAKGSAPPRRPPLAVSSREAVGSPSSLEASTSDFASAMKASKVATVARLVDIATEREGSNSLSVSFDSKNKRNPANGEEFSDENSWDKSNDSDETLPASPEPVFPGLSEDTVGVTGGRAVKFGVVQRDNSSARLCGKRTQ